MHEEVKQILPNIVALWEDDYNGIELTDSLEHGFYVFPLPEEF